MKPTDYLDLILAADTLRDELMSLGRVLRGTLNASAKGQIEGLVMKFRRRCDALQIDDELMLVVKNIEAHAGEIRAAVSIDTTSGYIRIEKLFSHIMNCLGFIKGYLYVSYSNTFLKKKSKDGDDDDDDVLGLEKGLLKLDV
eukprot:JZ550719.1.p1 GENE.JZ550719.1~~JZ550719.1.p1  ORF type:complete len:142 (+),score=37.22 JZ550719.1:30-455(+)